MAGNEDEPIDGGEPGGDQGGDPGGEGEGDLDLAALEQEFEEQLLAELGEGAGKDAGKKGDGQDGGKGAGSSAVDPRITDYVNKNYGGDIDAFLKAQYESREAGTRQAEKIRELETKVNALTSGPAKDEATTLKEALAASDEVQAINREIQDIDAENKAYAARQLELGKEADTLRQEVATLRGQLMKADADEKADISFQILNKETRLGSLQTEWAANDALINTNNRSKRTLSVGLRKAEAEVKAEMSNRERADRDRSIAQSRTRAAFNDSIIEQAKEYGLTIKRQSDGKINFDNESAKFVYHSVRTQMIEWLDALGDDAETVTAAEIHNAVKRIMAAAETAGFIKKGSAAKTPTDKSKGKAPRPVNYKGAVPPRMPLARNGGAGDGSGDGNGGGDNDRPRSREEMENSADFWRRRAEYLSTGGHRTGVLRRRLS